MANKWQPHMPKPEEYKINNNKDEDEINPILDVTNPISPLSPLNPCNPLNIINWS